MTLVYKLCGMYRIRGEDALDAQGAINVGACAARDNPGMFILSREENLDGLGWWLLVYARTEKYPPDVDSAMIASAWEKLLEDAGALYWKLHPYSPRD